MVRNHQALMRICFATATKPLILVLIACPKVSKFLQTVKLEANEIKGGFCQWNRNSCKSKYFQVFVNMRTIFGTLARGWDHGRPTTSNPASERESCNVLCVVNCSFGQSSWVRNGPCQELFLLRIFRLFSADYC